MHLSYWHEYISGNWNRQRCSSYEPYLRKNDSLKGTLSFLARAFSYQTKFHVNSQSIVVCYFRREDTTKEKYHYSLTWTCEFPNENDTYYFAHCYPYTYSDLLVSRVFILKYLQMSQKCLWKEMFLLNWTVYFQWPFHRVDGVLN